MFSRAIPSPLCQGGHCRPPGAPVIHSQAQRAVCPAPGRLTPDPARRGITTRGPRASVCLQHGADLSPCEVSQEKSETHRVSCPTVSGEHQAQPKGCKVLIPLAPPIAPEIGTHTDTLTNTHSQTYKQKIHTNTAHTLLTHIHVQKYKHSTHINTHEHIFTHKHMNIHTQHTNTNIRHRDHSHTRIHNNPYIETQHTPFMHMLTNIQTHA